MDDQVNTDSEKRKASSTRSSKRKKYEEVLSNLSQQVDQIQSFLFQKFPSEPAPSTNQNDNEEDILSIDLDANDLFSDLSSEITQNESVPVPKDFSLSFSTLTKEPSVPKTSPEHVIKLKDLQRFETDNWSDVRYAEVQKNYSFTPGYVDLESNDEIKPYDNFPHLSHTERGFAAITMGLIKQNTALEKGFRSLFAWIGENEVIEMKGIKDKVSEIFSEGEYSKISSDILQMTCGHRADLIQQRRDAVLKSVKNTFLKDSLRKIPPTCENLFQKQDFSTLLEKNGGVNKTFWPSRNERDSRSKKKPNAFENSNQSSSKQAMPAQGFQHYNALPHTTGISYGIPPAQGAYPSFQQHMHAPMLQAGFQGYARPYRQPAQGYHPYRPRTSRGGLRAGHPGAQSSNKPLFHDTANKNSRGRKF
ncbi:Uncharacterized protein OBRU01_24921 [Operophtera brumata]|uniref:Uncharacterized protein n=1 Tax=Operophtera brumata TaxID=104452 RepID=A0A0L7KIR5_OPEBR|nr:Uncharacterized protein OBRU01_24921 [Operophtera brumata]